MENLYNEEQRAWLNDLRERYRQVMNGICMAQGGGESPAEACKGPIGKRHAISRSHLRLIAEDENKIRANKEIGSFEAWSKQHEELQGVPVNQFSAGKWACQRHDAMFTGIDAKRIDLSEPENLFKAVCRVVLRQNHLMLARWNAHCMETTTEEGWRRFKQTAFDKPVGDEVAAEAEREWGKQARAVMGKMRDLEQRLAKKEWNSLEYRALLLKSKPMVAGCGCLAMQFGLSSLEDSDPRKAGWKDYVELGYMIVIPQEDGHAIITACEPATRFRAPEIARIHDSMPVCADPNKPYQAEEALRHRLSRRVWGLNELGLRESLYQAWPEVEQDKVQTWMKERRRYQPMHPDQAPNNLPTFF